MSIDTRKIDGTLVYVMLASLMAMTRFHHGGTESVLPDASLAVFFLAGVQGGRFAAFAGLWVVAVTVDIMAVGFGAVSAYCLSPAYGFLIPTYAVMIWAGRWTSQAPHWKTLLRRTAVALPASALLAFLISSYSFYAFSGKVNGVDWRQYGTVIFGDFPEYLAAALIYCGGAFGLAALRRLVNAGAHRKMA